MRAKLNFRQALPMTLLSASLAMVACDLSSETTVPAAPATSNTLDDSTRVNADTIDTLSYKNLIPEQGQESSSSTITPSNDSLTSNSSSSSLALETPPTAAPATHCFEPWYGSDGINRIETGYDNGTGTSGYWYNYGDDANGGMSVIEWPIPATGYDSDWLNPIIEYCGGFCGKYTLSKGILEYDPYVGLGFNLAGLDGLQGNVNPVPVDASAMGGIRVTYSCETAMTLELGLGEEKDKEIGYDNPSVTLPKTVSQTTKAFSWSQFRQAGWGSSEITGEEAAKILVAIRFRIQGKDGLTGNFNITRVEAYNPGDCASFVPPVFSSSSKNVNSSSSSKPLSSSSSIRSSSSDENAVGIKPKYSFETWNGSYDMERISTGFVTDMDDGGYWYEYNDSEDGGKSKINWMEPLGNEYDEKSFQPVIDVCGGVCGTFLLDKGDLQYDPYVGIGFDLAGHDANGNLVLADASSMEGVCIGYTSDASITVEMSLGEAKDKALDYDVPNTYLPKATGYKVKEIPWEKFTRSGWGKGENITGIQAAKTLGSLRFKIQGKDGTKGDFNIMAVGPYSNGSCNLMAAVPVLP